MDNILSNNKENIIDDDSIEITLSEEIQKKLHCSENYTGNQYFVNNKLNNEPMPKDIDTDEIYFSSNFKRMRIDKNDSNNLLKLAHIDYILNEKDSYCDQCFLLLDLKKGAILKNCSHTFCFDCLIEVVEKTENGRVIMCPFKDNNVNCRSSILLKDKKTVTVPKLNQNFEIDPKQDTIIKHLASEIEKMKSTLELIQSKTPQIIPDFNRETQNNISKKENKKQVNSSAIRDLQVFLDRNENTKKIDVNNSKIQDKGVIIKTERENHRWICEYCSNVNLESIEECLKCNKITKKIVFKLKNNLTGVWICYKCSFLNDNNIYVCDHCSRNGRDIQISTDERNDIIFENNDMNKNLHKEESLYDNLDTSINNTEAQKNMALEEKLMSIFNDL